MEEVPLVDIDRAVDSDDLNIVSVEVETDNTCRHNLKSLCGEMFYYNKRPMFVMPVILASLGLIMCLLVALPVTARIHDQYRRYIPTNFTVHGYGYDNTPCYSNSFKSDDNCSESCAFPLAMTTTIWGSWPVYDIKYINGQEIFIETSRTLTSFKIRVCMNNTKYLTKVIMKKYPMGLEVPVWIWDTDQNFMVFEQPQDAKYLPLAIFGIVFCSSIIFLNQILIGFCGFHNLVFPAYRCRDPYVSTSKPTEYEL